MRGGTRERYSEKGKRKRWASSGQMVAMPVKSFLSLSDKAPPPLLSHWFFFPPFNFLFYQGLFLEVFVFMLQAVAVIGLSP